MVSKFTLWALVSFVALIHSSYAGADAATRAVKFKQDITPLQAKLGQPFALDLLSLLSSTGAGKLTWSAAPEKPAWLVIDSANNRMTGTPAAADVGLKSFRLFVQDSEQGAITQVNFTVIAPPEWKEPNIDLGIQNEGVPWTFDLKTKVTNPAGGTTTFTATGLPNWMTLTPDGKLSGTPKRVNVGDYSGIQFSASGTGGTSSATAYGKVLKTVQPPKWVSNPITIEDAFEDKGYSRSITEFVMNYEQTDMRYELVSGPSWAQLSASGTIFGTPRKANIGDANITAMFRTTIDGKAYTGTTTFKLKVIHVNHAPEWLSDPLTLPQGFTKVAYSQDLSKSVRDIDDGDTLTFKLVSGPAWATISPAGTLAGTPDKANVGNNTFKVSVTDQGGLSDEVTVVMTVIKSNEPPFWNVKPTVLAKAKEDFSYFADLNSHATDPDKDPLTFTLLSGPAWASVSSNGTLSGTPGKADVGIAKFSVRVADGKSGSDVTDVLIEVEATNHAPEWLLNPIRVSVNEKQALSLDISVYARDSDKDKLSFQMIEGPAWGSLSVDGKFSGTPSANEIGENNFKARVSDPAGLFADVRVIVDVKNVNDKPYWTQDPITLENGKENAPYAGSIADFAKDPDIGDRLTFSKVSGPAWLSVSSDGSISGTPARKDAGTNTFRVRVIDSSNEFAEATLVITIDRVNTPPRWRQDPVLMVDAYEDKPYQFILAQYAADDDGDTLTFKKVSGPEWLQVAADGTVSGTPKKADIGEFSAVFEVSDGKATAQAGGKGNVIKTNHPPTVAEEFPTFIVKERQVFKVSLTDYIKDEDGDKLNFLLLDGGDWVTLFSNGDLVLKPLFKHVNKAGEFYTYSFRVDDGENSIQVPLRITVQRDPRPPVWLEDPIRMEAKTNEAFTGSLSTKAQDLDGISIKFSKKAGKPWLTVNAAGDLSGMPKNADLGENSFTVEVCNDLLCKTAILLVDVKPGIQKDVTQVDKAVAGAKAENLWVVDNSNNCSQLIKSLKTNIKYFYDDLKKADINHSGIYLSSDAHKWDGLPIRAAGQEMLFTWKTPNIVADFLERLASDRDEARCSNCYTSPIWSMFRFYERAPGLSEIYHKGYFEPGVPMDSLIITQQRDHYATFAKTKPQKNWTPNDYARNFVDFHTAEKKSYRVNTIAPECPKLISEVEASAAAPENAYRVLTQKTGGKYYMVGDCNFNMKSVLQDYAKQVIFRAYVHAKNRIKLTKLPIETNTIRVLIGDVPVSTDKWSYDSVTNEVILQWYLIDEGQIKPGDELTVEYRVS